MSFEFLNENEMQTTTSIVVNSNTGTVSNLLNRDLIFQYTSDGLDDDNTTASITISFDATTTIDRIALMQHNIKGYNVYYDGTTANAFSLTTTASTTTTQFTSNSETSQFFRCTQVDCTSVTFDFNTTQSANSEKAIGYLYVGSLLLAFERDPSAKDYRPRLNTKEIRHTLSDGGVRLHTINNKWSADIRFKYITESFRDNLRTVFDKHVPVFFCGLGTTTSWDGVMFEAIWRSPFDFYQFSDNAIASGFSGRISLLETPF